MKYALDTNIMIHILRGTPSVCAQCDKAIGNGESMVIPPFVNYEMRRGFLYKPAPMKEKAYKLFCSRYPVGEMNAEVWERAAVLYAKLRRSGRTANDADLLIAAFCIVNGYTLATANIRHFEPIEGVLLVNWVD